MVRQSFLAIGILVLLACGTEKAKTKQAWPLASTSPRTITMSLTVDDMFYAEAPKIRVTVNVPTEYNPIAVVDSVANWGGTTMATAGPNLELYFGFERRGHNPPCFGVNKEQTVLTTETRADARIVECRRTDSAPDGGDPTQWIAWTREIPHKDILRSKSADDPTLVKVDALLTLTCSINFRERNPTPQQVDDARTICASVRWEEYTPEGHATTPPAPAPQGSGSGS